jgi:hypothetical protein
VAPLGAGSLSLSLRNRLDLSGTRPTLPMQRLLVHATTSIPPVAEVRIRQPALGAYDQRALLMAEYDDVVCVRDEIDASYLDYLRSLGIGPSAANVVTCKVAEGVCQIGLTESLLQHELALAQVARLMAAGQLRIEAFIAGPMELLLAQRLSARIGASVFLLGDPKTVKRVNRKDLQRQWAQELGVPLAEGQIVTLEQDERCRPETLEPLRKAVEERLRLGHRALIRGCEGASGSATRIVSDARELAETVAWASDRCESVYLIDRYHHIRASPNILFFLPADPARPPCFIAATDQILDASLNHTGNRFPSEAALLDEMVEHAERLAQHLRKQGYAGWLGCDFCEHVDQTTGKPCLFFAELNARVNGACYPVAAAARRRASGVGVAAVVSGIVKTATPFFADLIDRLGNRLLSPERDEGIMPYNIGCLPHGYCSLVAFDATSEAAQQQWDRLAQELLVCRASVR